MTGGAAPDDFDPYWEWLRIPRSRRPPTYYDLLGVGIDETDEDEIRQAADARYTRVRVNALGPHSQIASRVLEELAHALHCLTDPRRREDYRRQLQQEGRWPGGRAGEAPAKRPPPRRQRLDASPAGDDGRPLAPPFPPTAQPPGLPEPAGSVTLGRIDWEEKPPSVGQRAWEAAREFDLLLAAVAGGKDGPRHNLLRLLVAAAPLLLFLWFFLPPQTEPFRSAAAERAGNAASEREPPSTGAARAASDETDRAAEDEIAGKGAESPSSDDGSSDASPDSPPAGDPAGPPRAPEPSRVTRRATIWQQSAPVECLAFSPDGAILAAAGSDTTTCLLDPATGRVRRTLSAGPGTRWLAFSPNGVNLFSNAGAWRVADGRPWQSPWPDEVREASSLLFSPEGSVLATVEEGSVSIRDPSTGMPRRVLRVLGDTIHCIAFRPDASLLALAGTRRLLFWNTVANRQERIVGGHSGPIRCVAFSPDGSILASGSDDHTVRLWAVGAGLAVHVLDDHAGAVEALGFHPDGSMFASAGSDGTVKLWNPATGSLIETLQGHAGPVHAVAFSPTGSVLASAGDDGTVRLWEFATNAPRSAAPTAAPPPGPPEAPESPDLAFDETRGAPRAGSRTSPRLLHTFEGHPFGAELLAFGADGSTLVSVGSVMKVWDVATGVLRNTVDVGSRTAVLGPDDTILTTKWVGRATLRDLATGEPRTEMGSFAWAVRALSPDGLLVAAADDYGRNVRLVDARTGETRHRVQVPMGEQVEAVALSPRGSLLATGSYRYVRLWSVRTGLLEAELKQKSSVKSIAFSPAGRLLACGSARGPVYLWDYRTKSLHRTLEGHSHWVDRCAFSRDGATLASAGHGNTVRLWDVATGESLATLEAHRDWVTALAFRPDGTLLATSSRDETIRIWQIAAPGD